jgi:hypothetical protein
LFCLVRGCVFNAVSVLCVLGTWDVDVTLDVARDISACTQDAAAASVWISSLCESKSSRRLDISLFEGELISEVSKFVVGCLADL